MCTVGGYVVVPNANPRGKFEPGRLVQVRNTISTNLRDQQSPFTTCVVMNVKNKGTTAFVAPLIGDGSEGLTIISNTDSLSAWYLMPLSVGTSVDTSYDNTGGY